MCGVLKPAQMCNWVTNPSDMGILVNLYKSSAFIEACHDIFFNEIIAYDIMKEEQMQYKKNHYNSNYRQNMSPI